MLWVTRSHRAGPVIQQFFTLALASEGLAMFKSAKAPRSGLGFFSTCSCCLTWCCYGFAKMNPSIYLPNAAGFVVGTVTTLLFIGLTEQRMGTTLVIMAAMASAVLTLMFGAVMPAEEATQWTANIGILQAVVMLGSGCAVWPTVRCHCAVTNDASACLISEGRPIRAAGPTRRRCKLSLASGALNSTHQPPHTL